MARARGPLPLRGDRNGQSLGYPDRATLSHALDRWECGGRAYRALGRDQNTLDIFTQIGALAPLARSEAMRDPSSANDGPSHASRTALRDPGSDRGGVVMIGWSSQTSVAQQISQRRSFGDGGYTAGFHRVTAGARRSAGIADYWCRRRGGTARWAVSQSDPGGRGDYDDPLSRVGSGAICQAVVL